MNIKKIILSQKIISRKIIAKLKLFDRKTADINEKISQERDIIEYDFSNIDNIDSFTDVIHKIKHHGDKKRCKLCKLINAEMLEDSNLNEKEDDLLPRFGNLISILEENAAYERSNVERKRMPSQNDLTRWALKDAVLAYYQGLNMPHDMPIVLNRFDDRLITELAPNFENISNIWLQKLDELRRKNDKYMLTMDEYDKAESDLSEEMRGSAFEKQLDRYREDFMKQLMR